MADLVTQMLDVTYKLDNWCVSGFPTLPVHNLLPVLIAAPGRTQTIRVNHSTSHSSVQATLILVCLLTAAPSQFLTSPTGSDEGPWNHSRRLEEYAYRLSYPLSRSLHL